MNLVREAFRLLRPGGTLALVDSTVYDIIITVFSFFLFWFHAPITNAHIIIDKKMLILLLLPLADKVKGPSGIAFSCFRALFLF